MIKDFLGDLFAALASFEGKVMIPHVVNNVGRMGSGFAKAAFTYFPAVREQYLAWGHPYILGDVQFVYMNNKITFANMVGQSGTISVKNPRPVKYAALVKAMERVESVCESKDAEPPTQIVCPKFGAGLAGGNWDFIEELINEIWLARKIPVSVYYFDDEPVASV